MSNPDLLRDDFPTGHCLLMKCSISSCQFVTNESANDSREKFTYAIITTDPNELVLDYHKRMPWIVDQDIKQNWMTVEFNQPDLLTMMNPYPSHLIAVEAVAAEPRQSKKDRNQGNLGF